ncbi:ABC transporter permease [Anaerocolumna sp. AGMB13025]|uniref:ABC transporter permease n=1 Tax=Anaerocolumna sp. AGMB13025 TaxID=3039116 RepID=UPI00242019AA|nr:ABC transporter permease [Anaerocolumna sp. AGMB13025]WFR59603.1 ABC transporter permease [Anaerocolumna sp. AGMB13025]
MQVFKLYFKLLKSAAPALIIYLIIFTVLIFLLSTNHRKDTAGFEETKIETALINYDKDSILVQDFLDYISRYCDFKVYEDNDIKLSDALFFHQVEYILTIPYDFGEDFLAGKEVEVEKKNIPGGTYNLSVDNAVNTYLNAARLYLKALPDISEEDLVVQIRQDLEKTTQVSFIQDNNKGKENNFYNQYFNTASYILLSCCLLGIGMIMLTFHNVDILRRNMVTPLTNMDMNLQLIGGNLIFVLTYDVFFILFGFLINQDKTVNGNVLLYWLNLIVFSFSALSMSYLAAILVKGRQANNALSTVLPLGLSFISGAFVPQLLLGDSVLKMASFTPLYWFIKGNDTIAGLARLDWENIKSIIYYMLIQIGFAAALFSLSLVISKNKRQNN